jgi:hypothetical protein
MTNISGARGPILPGSRTAEGGCPYTQKQIPPPAHLASLGSRFVGMTAMLGELQTGLPRKK